jgi:hypothetical protein
MENHIAICTPCYGGQVYINYLTSILHVWQTDSTTTYSYVFKSNDSRITHVRNSMCAQVMAAEHFTHLLWIDADVGFTPEAIQRLVSSGYDVACGLYPLKDYVVPASIPAMNGVDFRHRFLDFPFNPAHRESDIPADGFVEVTDAPCGFMLIKREVLTAMREFYPELHYIADGTKQSCYRFFDTLFDDGRYLSEDYAFCRRWQHAGGKIMADLNSNLTHRGTHTFGGHGTVLESIMAGGNPRMTTE